MKFIFDGGWYKKDKNSVSKNILSRYTDFLLENLKQNKKLLVVTNAKPVDYYRATISTLINTGADFIDRNTKSDVGWSKYDIILTLGGDPKILFDELSRLHFSVRDLKNSVLYIGESAGTMVMGSYFYYNYDDINENISFSMGFMPDDNVIYLVHDNNPIYIPDFVKSSVKEFARNNNLKYIAIKENEVIEK